MSLKAGKKLTLSLDSNLVTDDLPLQVVPKIFVGSIHSAFNLDALTLNGVTHILNASRLPITFPKQFTYLSVEIRDKGESNILSCIPTTNIFIEAGMDEGGVLVHCFGGKSRSPAFIAAYLMSSYEWTFDHAYNVIKDARPTIEINAGFESQLRAYAAANYDVYRAQQLLLVKRIRELHLQRNKHRGSSSGGSVGGVSTGTSSGSPPLAVSNGATGGTTDNPYGYNYGATNSAQDCKATMATAHFQDGGNDNNNNNKSETASPEQASNLISMGGQKRNWAENKNRPASSGQDAAKEISFSINTSLDGGAPFVHSNSLGATQSHHHLHHSRYDSYTADAMHSILTAAQVSSAIASQFGSSSSGGELKAAGLNSDAMAGREGLLSSAGLIDPDTYTNITDGESITFSAQGRKVVNGILVGSGGDGDRTGTNLDTSAGRGRAKLLARRKSKKGTTDTLELDIKTPECRLSRPHGSGSVRVIPPLRGLEKQLKCSWCNTKLFTLANVVRLDLETVPLLETADLTARCQIQYNSNLNIYDVTNGSESNNSNNNNNFGVYPSSQAQEKETLPSSLSSSSSSSLGMGFKAAGDCAKMTPRRDEPAGASFNFQQPLPSTRAGSSSSNNNGSSSSSSTSGSAVFFGGGPTSPVVTVADTGGRDNTRCNGNGSGAGAMELDMSHNINNKIGNPHNNNSYPADNTEYCDGIVEYYDDDGEGPMSLASVAGGGDNNNNNNNSERTTLSGAKLPILSMQPLHSTRHSSLGGDAKGFSSVRVGGGGGGSSSSSFSFDGPIYGSDAKSSSSSSHNYYNNSGESGGRVTTAGIEAKMTPRLLQSSPRTQHQSTYQFSTTSPRQQAGKHQQYHMLMQVGRSTDGSNDQGVVGHASPAAVTAVLEVAAAAHISSSTGVGSVATAGHDSGVDSGGRPPRSRPSSGTTPMGGQQGGSSATVAAAASSSSAHFLYDDSPRVQIPPHRQRELEDAGGGGTAYRQGFRPQSAEKRRWLARVSLLDSKYSTTSSPSTAGDGGGGVAYSGSSPGRGGGPLSTVASPKTKSTVSSTTTANHHGSKMNKMIEDDEQASILAYGDESKYFHLEYLSWMGGDQFFSVERDSGDICCPTCQKVVGCYSWNPSARLLLDGRLEPPLIRIHKSVVQQTDVIFDATPISTPRAES